MITTDSTASVRPAPAWLPRIMEQLTALRSVAENWDGYGAAAPQPESIDAAEIFLLLLRSVSSIAEPYVTPTRVGGVMLLWKSPEQALEIDFKTGDAAEYLYSDARSGSELEGELELGSGLRQDLLTLLVRFEATSP